MANVDALKWFQEGARRMKDGAVGIADRVPVYAQISHHSARLLGVSSVEFFSDAAAFLRCEIAADLFYEIDAPTIHFDIYNIEAEALGATLIWDEKQIPAVDTRAPLLSSADAFRDLKAIKTGSAGRMPYALEINSRLLDMGLSPKVRFTGLFTLAANLLGLQELSVAVLTQPDRVHRLMRFLTDEIVAPWIVYQREHCGSNVTATGSDALASPPLLSADMVREFCLSYIEDLEEKVGGIRLAGLWGESSLSDPVELLELKRAGSPAAIQVLDPDISALGPRFFRDYADRSGVSLVMGLDANLVGSGTGTDIAARTRRFIEEGGMSGRFVLFINDIPYATPVENVRAVVAAAQEYRASASNQSYERRHGIGEQERRPTFEEALAAADRLMRR